MNPAKSKADNPYVAAFEQAASFRSDEPAWLRELREASFARFNEVGYPTVNEEEWKYTNVGAIARSDFAPVIQANGTKLTKERLQAWTYVEAPARLVFVNGVFRPDLSTTGDLPDSVTAIDLKAAADKQEFAPAIRDSFARRVAARN